MTAERKDVSGETAEETKAAPYVQRLDHETESVIELFAIQEWLSGRGQDNKASSARNALRARIRVLVDEAEAKGYAKCAPRPGKLPEPEWEY